ncbi:MAG TPA: Rid family detoxifying hydrolase [Gemmatimonadales bacterium]|nr:Rid family detoxifying hydrolase [Gemmatimonadales bacterium]
MRTISTPDAPKPAGHYSQAVVHGGMVYVAGMLPLDPVTMRVVEGGIAPQTERTLRNVAAVLEAAGSDLDRLVSVTIFVTDIATWPQVNEVFARLLGDHRPARAVVPVLPIRHGALIEIQAIAAVDPDKARPSGSHMV